MDDQQGEERGYFNVGRWPDLPRGVSIPGGRMAEEPHPAIALIWKHITARLSDDTECAVVSQRLSDVVGYRVREMSVDDACMLEALAMAWVATVKVAYLSGLATGHNAIARLASGEVTLDSVGESRHNEEARVEAKEALDAIAKEMTPLTEGK